MSENNKLSHCSFCGTHKDIVKKLIVGDDVAICNDCIELCNNLIIDDNATEQMSQFFSFHHEYNYYKFPYSPHQKYDHMYG